SFQPTRVDMLPLALRQATNLLTSGRPGPVNLDVPYNLFQEEAEVELEPMERAGVDNRPGASSEAVSAVVDLLLSARTPLIFVGHGVTLSEAGKELTELQHLLQIPQVASPNGMGTLDMTDALSLGFIGRNGTFMANQAGRHADVLLAIGARFDDRSASSWKQGYSWNIPPTRLIQVDIDTSEIGRNYEPTIGIQADARTFVRQLLAELDRRGISRHGGTAEWLSRIAGWRREWRAFIAPNF